MSASLICVLLFLATLISRSIFLFSHPYLTALSSVMGVPFSDARMWDLLAESIAVGKGMTGPWAADRPFYPFFLALFYTWTGPSVFVAQIVNIVLSSLTTSLVYLVGRKAFNQRVGLVSALVCIFSFLYQQQSLLLLSETLGLFLFTLNITLLLFAYENGRPSLYFWAGLVYALCNLTQPVSLLTLPAMGFLAYKVEKDAKRKILPVLLCLFAGILLVWTPWLIRQKSEYGIFALSKKSMDSFYAATSTEHSTWNPTIYFDLEKSGPHKSVKDRYEFFRQAAFENLRAHPVAYGKKIIRSFALYFRGMRVDQAFESIAALFAFILLFLCLQRARAPTEWLFPSVAMAAGVYLFNFYPGLLVVMLCSALLISSRSPAKLLIVSSLLLCGLALGLVNAGDSPRFRILTNWFFYFLYFDAINTAFRVPAFEEKLFAPKNFELPPSFFRRVWVAASLSAALFFLLSVSRLAYLNFMASPALAESDAKKFDAHLVADELIARKIIDKKTPLITSISRRTDEKNNQKILIAVGRLTRHVYFLPPGYGVFKAGITAVIARKGTAPRAKLLEPRPYARTAFYFVADGFDELNGIIPGEIPREWIDQEFVLVGKMSIDLEQHHNYSRRIIETMMLIPYQREDGTLLWEEALPIRTESSALN